METVHCIEIILIPYKTTGYHIQEDHNWHSSSFSKKNRKLHFSSLWSQISLFFLILREADILCFLFHRWVTISNTSAPEKCPLKISKHLMLPHEDINRRSVCERYKSTIEWWIHSVYIHFFVSFHIGNSKHNTNIALNFIHNSRCNLNFYF